MSLTAIIGLELHIEMSTKSKMFSDAPVSYGAEPNTMTSINDFAFPGTMPTVNKQAVVNAIRVCDALHMDIDQLLAFDRKNYFYSDLPKGYQITQYYRPIGRNGYLTFKSNNKLLKIDIERLHLEEDTCKQFHVGDSSYLDYNRAGIPLLEIVTKPQLTSSADTRRFVEEIRSIISYLDVSSGKMEEGNIRVDVNVSLIDKENNYRGNKVEIKNLNSLSNIEKAISYEIDRQRGLLEMGKQVKQETRRFDENKSITVALRDKVSSIDYRYFVEPNIAPIKLSSDFIKSVIASSPELPSDKRVRYLQIGLNEYDADLILSNKDTAMFFEECLKYDCDAKHLANCINSDIQSLLNKDNVSIAELNISPKELAALIKSVQNKLISVSQAKELLPHLIDDKESVNELIKKFNLTQINDETIILEVVTNVIRANMQAVSDYKNGKDRAIGFLIGLVMKETKGQANPTLVNKLVLEEIKRR